MSRSAAPADVLAGHARWCVVEGDAHEVLRELGKQSVDHVITDPPYSEQVHRAVRRSGRAELPDVADFSCRTRRTVDLGFEHFTEEQIAEAGASMARAARRWVLVFSDVESAHLWRQALIAGGLAYKRTGAWLRVGGAPQFSGDKPAPGFDAVTIAHRKGRSRWNGGGAPALWAHPVVANRKGQQGSRQHAAQKPLTLMVELVGLFTEPNDVVLDPFAGSGSTGHAAVRLGRRIILVERDPKHAELARHRCELAEAASPIGLYQSEPMRAGRQQRLFG